jgi:tetratricopeptide (TPR) repeat protein
MYQAVVLQGKMMDFEDYHEESLFFALMDTTIAKSQGLIKGHSTEAEAWLYFYLGMAQGFKGVHEGKLERWWSAFRDGWRGVGNLKKAVRINPDLHDAQLGIGSFIYWRSRMMHKLSWLPVIRDERKKGIALVQRAAAKSRYSRIAARAQLVWILMKEGRYDEAIVLSSGLSRRYPDCRIFKWGWAEGLKHKRAWGPALRLYREMLASYEADPQSNHYGAIQCRRKIAAISFEQKQYSETISQCRRILRYDLDEANQARLEDKLANVRKLLKRAQERLR